MNKRIHVKRTELGFMIKSNFRLSEREVNTLNRNPNRVYFFRASLFNEVSMGGNCNDYSFGMLPMRESLLAKDNTPKVTKAYNNFSEWVENVGNVLKQHNIELVTKDYEDIEVMKEEKVIDVQDDVDADKIVECCSCSFEGVKSATKIHDGDIYCKDCYDQEFIECEDCGEVIYREDAKEYSCTIYCEDCYDNKFTTCSDCGSTIECEDSTSNDNGDIYCQSCYDDNYIHCTACGEEVHSDDRCSSDCGDDYCDECYYDRFTHCCSCECEVRTSNACYDEDSGENYCSDCYEEECGSSNTGLRSYGYKPSSTFYGKNDYHLGIELEVEGDYDQVTDDLDHTHLYYKSDGSLDDGFEIVSHPMTYKYMKQNKVFENALAVCRKARYKSHDTSTCGMHIHVSKELFTSLHIYKLLRLIYENEGLFLALAQRKKSQADQWASFSDNSLQTIKKSTKDRYKGSRYEAINLSTDKTIEFRFMKGNLLLERFNKNVEIVLSTINFTKSASMSKISKEEYLDYLFKNEKMYKNLVEFCKMKEIGFVKQLPAVAV